jgi:c(7)-type cytochrome triheme protein
MQFIRNIPFIVRYVGFVVVVLVGVGILYFIWGPNSLAAPAQPMSFPHQRMVGAGVQCLFCHTTATISPAAGIPSVQKCVGCHNVIARNTPAIQTLFNDYWNPKKPIPWVQVNRLPRYVHFTHSVHVNSGINCERCHGNVGQMNEDYQVVRMNMGWCLSCHNQQPNREQLRDCSICHY